jgi:hypothetical protein
LRIFLCQRCFLMRSWTNPKLSSCVVSPPTRISRVGSKCCAQSLRHYRLRICTFGPKARKVRSKVLDDSQGTPPKLLSCQYLYFCASKASRLSEHLDEFAGDGRQFNAAVCAGADACIAPLRLHVVLFKLLHVQLLLRIQLVPHLETVTA